MLPRNFRNYLASSVSNFRYFEHRSTQRDENIYHFRDSANTLAHGFFVAVVAMTLWVDVPEWAHAQSPLTGSGSHLTLPPFLSPVPGAGLTYTEIPSTSFTGTWGTNAAAAWQGTFTSSGPIPIGARPSGTSTYDFSTLASGHLPSLTTFFISDLDHSGGLPELLTLRAFDVANGVTLTNPWLDIPFGVNGTGSGVGSVPALLDMPGWDWNVTSPFAYTFNGGPVLNNPNINLVFLSNQAFERLIVTRDNSLSNFGLIAPAAVPEPSSLAMLAAVFGGTVFFRRRP